MSSILMQQQQELLVLGIKIPQSIKVNCGVRYSVTLLVEKSGDGVLRKEFLCI